jgi:hypothetical protein
MNAAIAARRPRIVRLIVAGCLLGGCVAIPARCDERIAFFERRIRPLFERACVECHAGDEASGGLRLSDRQGWEDAGVIEPGRPQASRLLEVLRSEDPDEVMPPPDAGHQVTPREIGFVERWIADGAVDPRAGAGPADHVGPRLRSRVFEITADDRSYWAFQPLAEPVFSEAAAPAAAKIDLLVSRGFGPRPRWTMNPPATPRQLVRRATFGLCGQDEPASSDQAELDDADDLLVTTSTVFLGLTVGCARCHNHKYDPLSQRDYYSLLGFFRGLDPYGQPKKGGGSRATGRISRELPFAAGTAEVLVAVERAAPPPTFVLHRGDRSSPREAVEPNPPALLRELHGEQSAIVPLGDSSGRRLTLARWLVGPGHPLVARAMVNRIWQRHFGLGIVDTPDDFGRTGSAPSNLPLLDFLAREFVESGWSIHHVHRIIMASRAYRTSSRAAQAAAGEEDPDSCLFWRQRVRRLDAEAIRDSVLFFAGRLAPKASGPSVFPALSSEILDQANPAARRWPESPPDEQDCRSVYLAVKRGLPIPFLEVMDRSIGSLPVIVRPSTTTAPQALLLLNDPWMHAQASRLLLRLQEEAGPSPTAMIERLWQICFQRPATAAEWATAVAYVEEHLRLQEPSGADDRPPQAAWESLVRAVLNSNEAIFID